MSIQSDARRVSCIRETAVNIKIGDLKLCDMLCDTGGEEVCACPPMIMCTALFWLVVCWGTLCVGPGWIYIYAVQHERAATAAPYLWEATPCNISASTFLFDVPTLSFSSSFDVTLAARTRSPINKVTPRWTQ